MTDDGGWTPSERAAKDPHGEPNPMPWWKTAVVYQIYPRSFLDTDGDGVGDLTGIRDRLPYLARLGVDCLWLSPFYRSPMADFGYDVADYCDVDPLFGTLADFDDLLTAAHAHGLRVIVDFVPNHTSDRHPWFVDARSSRDADHRDWYVWRDPAGPVAPGGDPGPPPNNWVSAFTRASAWTWEEATGQWYLHLFLAEQPDLDWSNPAVVDAMHGVLRFWLDRGVDGFRIDVVHALGKDPALPDNPARTSHVPYSSINDDPRTHPILRDLRQLVDSYPGERVTVGEVFLRTTAQVATYYGDNDELHLSFNFPPLFAPWEAEAWRDRIDTTIAELDPRDAWPTWVLSNHDNPRHRTRYGGGEARARAAVLLLLGLRGTPFVYAGEELGLDDAVVPPERVVDPGGRDGCRAPIPWTVDANHGWASDTPWLPWPPDSELRNAERGEADPGSMLHLYRRALAARRSSPALRTGTFSWLDGPPGTLVWEREAGPEMVMVAVNMTSDPVTITVATGGGWTAIAASDGGTFTGQLAADSAVWLRRD
ncbi:MAG: alpha-amylase family glycosyl hydrolase [Acidimicrobiales bacterium]